MPESVLSTIHVFLPAALLVRDSGYSFFREKKLKAAHPVSRWSSGLWAHCLTPLATVLYSLFPTWSKYTEADPIDCLPKIQFHCLACWKSLDSVWFFAPLCFSEKMNPVHISLSKSCFIWASHGVLFPLVKNVVRQGHFTRFWPRTMRGGFLHTSEKEKGVSSLREIDT